VPYFPVLRSEQYPATSDTQCISVIIPDGDEFKALLVGLLSLAADVGNYDLPDSAQSEGLSAVWDDAFSQTDFGGCVPDPVVPFEKFQWMYSLVPQFCVAHVGAALSFSNSGAGGLCIQANASNEGTFWLSEDPIFLRAGVYSVRVSYAKTSASAKIDIPMVMVGGGETLLWAQLDAYSASTQLNQVAQTDMTVASDLTFIPQFRVNGKNAASSAYVMNYHGMSITWLHD